MLHGETEGWRGGLAGCGPCGCDGTNERSAAGSLWVLRVAGFRGDPRLSIRFFFLLVDDAKDRDGYLPRAAAACGGRRSTHVLVVLKRYRSPRWMPLDGGAVGGGSVCAPAGGPMDGSVAWLGLEWWGCPGGGGVLRECAPSKVGLHSGLRRQGSGLSVPGWWAPSAV